MILRGELTYPGSFSSAIDEIEINDKTADACFIASRVWICRTCGNTFARLVFRDFAGRARPFLPLSGVCHNCPPSFGFIPGSVWLGWDRDWADAMPARVMNREVLLHINHLEQTP